MKLTNKEKDEITWRVVDSLYEKLANELEYELQEHESFASFKITKVEGEYEYTNDTYMDLFNEMTIKIVNYFQEVTDAGYYTAWSSPNYPKI